MNSRFDWDAHNVEHVGLHGITLDEVEQVVTNSPFELRSDKRRGEQRTMLLGKTDAGRVLVAVVTVRAGKVRVVTAYPASPKLIAEFKEKTP